MVEFAVVCLVVYLLLAAILTFGFMLYCDQTLQQAADLAAREIAITPLWADDTFAHALHDKGLCHQVYDERYLVLTIDVAMPLAGSNPVTFNGGHPIGDFPLVIQQLYPLMIYDELVPDTTPNPPSPPGPPTPTPTPLGIPVLRYPGAVFKDPNPDPTLNPPASGYLVRIPVMTYTPAPEGPLPGIPVPVPAQQVAWLRVMDEIPSTINPDPFPVSSSQRGVVALRINYPFQSATMSGFEPPANPTSPPGPPGNPVIPIIANGTVYLSPPPDMGDSMVSALSEGYGPNGGHYSLGQQAAWAVWGPVRPYRRVLSAQAIYRREIFQ
ncbi:MAG: TadE/TadG family type IV pilus assembly protein [Thermoguttaceae bacterium]